MTIRRAQDESQCGHQCWNREAQTQALRVELTNGSSFVFPYARLAFVRADRASGQEVLRVSIDTHEIQIIGRNLHEVELALQRFAVEWVRELPARYSPQATDGHAWITSIVVNELED